ncbi:MAG: alpha-L-rhamnosidase [Acidobacteria bacterium]|nr:alpha-L-rhamnosidase [Acidobacteriota bacterium]
MSDGQGSSGPQPAAGVARRTVLKLSAAALGGAVVPAGATPLGRAPAPVVPERPGAPRPRWTPQDSSPFPAFHERTEWDRQGTWNASWVRCPDLPRPPFVTAYRLRFEIGARLETVLRVSADERYELFLDGVRAGRGSERGNLESWFYETNEVTFEPGEHTLVARVWSLGPYAPIAQVTAGPGFLLAAPEEHEDLLSTGHAPWEAKLLDGYAFEPPVYVWGLSTPMTLDAARFPWGFEQGEGEGWREVEVAERAASRLLDYGIAPPRYLRAGTLPPPVDRPWTKGRVRHVSPIDTLDTISLPVRSAEHLESEEKSWTALLAGTAPVTVPPRTRRRVILDLEDYLCAYPEVVTSGGAGGRVRARWAEALRLEPEMWEFEKGNRDEIEGKFFFGMGDTFLPDGEAPRRFDTLWWACGRYVEVVVETQEDPLTLERLVFHETRHPLEMESEVTVGDEKLDALQPMLVRGMQMCSHETFFDCPYFEQMQYVGDARLEALVHYVMTRDDRLPRKALYMIDDSRNASGLTGSRPPVRQRQVIPWFSLLYVGMLHEHALWRDDPAFVGHLVPGARAILDAFLERRGGDGLVRTPEGWSDTERTTEGGTSGLTHWLLLWTLGLAAELEDMVGEPEVAQRYRRHADELAPLADAAFWDERRALYRDAPDHEDCSELVQAFAVLSGRVPEGHQARLAEALVAGKDLRPASVHGSYYVLETARALGLADLYFDRLQLWVDMRERGLKTPQESREPTRSDCHAWGSSPLFQFFATILGIRPAAPGFRRVEIAPFLGPLPRASGRLVHPAGGEIVVDLRREGEKLHGRVVLPEGVRGTLRLPDGTRELPPGESVF